MDWNSRRITAILESALLEDQAHNDQTTRATIDPERRAVATLLAKQDCILSGLGAIGRIFEVFAHILRFEHSHPHIAVAREMFDGVRVTRGTQVLSIHHDARSILSCERVILNVVQRLSGIATTTRRYVDAVAGTKAKVLDTRKTVPGLRVLDKYAVTCGGGHNHRLDLSDGVLIKNNHLSLGGGITTVLANAIKNRSGSQPIEIEVRTMAELDEALANGAEAILLDNMTPDEIRECVARVQRHSRRVPLEASGGITLENIRAYAETGVDFISVGALTHSVQAVDLSLRVDPA